MPSNTRVKRCVYKLKKTYPIGTSIAICQKSTKQSYKTGKTIRSTKKNKKDKHVGHVELVKLPNNINRRYRWIVKKRADGRYIARAPKPNVLIRDLNKKRDNDFNAEHLLPKNFTF